MFWFDNLKSEIAADTKKIEDGVVPGASWKPSILYSHIF